MHFCGTLAFRAWPFISVVFFSLAFSGCGVLLHNPTALSSKATVYFMYVLNDGSDDISIFKVDSSDGTLTETDESRDVATTDLASLVFSPNGKFLYTLRDVGSDTIDVYSVNTSTGALTHTGQSYTANINNPYFIAFHPSAGHAYVANSQPNNILHYTFDSATGALGFVAAHAGTNIQETLVIDHSGQYLYAPQGAGGSNVEIFDISQTDYSLSVNANSPIATGTLARRAMMHPSLDVFYTGHWITDDVRMHTINLGNGDASNDDTEVAGNVIDGLDLSADGRYLAASGEASPFTTSLYTVSAVDGSLTLAHSLNHAGTQPRDMEFGPNDQFVYFSDAMGNTIIRMAVNTSTNQLESPTIVGTTGTTPYEVHIVGF